jgi:non-specific serine/threonine protein kinase
MRLPSAGIDAIASGAARALAVPESRYLSSLTVGYAKAVTGAATLASFQWDWAWVHSQNSRAHALAIRAVEAWRVLGDDGHLAYALHSLGRTFTNSGDAEAARVVWEEGLALSRAAANKPVQSLLLTNLGYQQFREGHEDTALALLNEALALAGDAGYAKMRIRVLQYLGDISNTHGDRIAARAYREQALSLARSVDDRWEVGRLLDQLAFAAAEDGDGPRTRRLLLEAVDLSRHFQIEAGLVLAADDLARLESGSGQHERAMRLDGAIAAWYAAQQIVKPGKREQAAREERAVLARRALGPRADVAAAEGRALSLLQVLDEALAADRLTATQPKGAVLTPREVEVVRELAAGNSNRQIAEALVIAVTTVERHVANILGKLGLRSRAQVVIWAAQHGFLGDPAVDVGSMPSNPRQLTVTRSRVRPEG